MNRKHKKIKLNLIIDLVLQKPSKLKVKLQKGWHSQSIHYYNNKVYVRDTILITSHDLSYEGFVLQKEYKAINCTLTKWS